ncbi:MAG: SdrD B-like domain-containing protein, partial [Bacteroidota bacterium]
LNAGTYSVTVTDANGCTDVAMASITVIDVSVSLGSTDVSCNGGEDGTATVTVMGGDLPYDYDWSNGASTPTITNLSPGVYTVTVTEANGCKAIGSVTVSEPTPINLSVNVTDILCAGGAIGAIDLTVSGGTPAYSYLWSTGATTEDINNLAAGTYTVTVTDANNCSETISATVIEPSSIELTAEVTDVLCNGDSTGAVDLSVSGGTPPYTYDWSTDGPEMPNNDLQDVSNLAAGTYSVNVMDANACPATLTVTVSEPPALSIAGFPTNVLCTGDATGMINIVTSGGTPPYSYNWSNGATTEDISNVPAGTYSVTATDANDCTITTTTTVTEPAPLAVEADINDLPCNGDGSGSINLIVTGGTAPYTFMWSNGEFSEDLVWLDAGTYSVTITDANDCTITTSATVNEPAALMASTVVSDVLCNGDATGSINLSVSGGTQPYTYLWSTGAATEDISNLMAGNYTVTITDANNCSIVSNATVQEASTVSIAGNVTNAVCNGEASGAIDITPSGGTPSYTYNWSNGATTQDLTNVNAGTYMVTVTDANGCTDVATFTITQPDAISLNVNAPIIQCGGSATGSIAVIPSGGTGPYTYLWNNGETTATINDLLAGIYMVTVTDANGCQEVANAITLAEVPQISCTVEVVQEPTMGNNGSLTVNVDGGTIPFTYLWSNGATTQTIDNLPAGTYSVTVTDANNCTTTCTGTLEAFAGIGDFVWEDLNLDGIQDPNEPGFPGVTVNLKNAAGVVIATTTTDENGFYSFMGLDPGTYSVQFVVPDGFDYTASEQGTDDALDSDIIPGMNGMTGTYDLEPGEFDMTVDAGLIIPPNAIVGDPCNCLNNATTDENGQFGELLTVEAYSGMTWTIVERMNMFIDDASNDPPAVPQQIPVGTVLTETPLGNGLSRYDISFRLIDAVSYSAVVRGGVFELTYANTCVYPDIFFENEPPGSLCRFDPAFPLDANSTIPGDLVYTIAGQEIEVLDPSTLPVGAYDLEVRLLPFDEFECEAVLIVSFDITDDCPAKVGDFVWNDTNFNGIQDPGEPGISNVKVTITSQDGTFMDMQFTDENGMYMFMVDPGTYKITFEQPDGLVPSPQDQGGDDAVDSDVDPAMLMTDFFTLGPNEQNFTFDAGFYDPCIANISDPGTIGFDQEICGPGNIPDLFVELTPATGGVGTINYLWMKNTVDPTQDIAFWSPIPNSDSPNFQSGPIYESTYFTRCVRRNNCVYLESNIIFVEVGDDADAVIDGPNLVCELETVTYQAVGAEGADQVEWSFSGPANVTNNPDGSVDVFWGSFGIFSVTLSVTDNGCTATRTMSISVISNPATCGGGFTANGAVNNLLTREINVNWILPVDGADLLFTIERSQNGVDFTDVGTMNEPTELVNGDMGYYSFDDITPLAGRNFYRVRLADTHGNVVYSNIIELMLATDPNALGQVYPNPAVGNMIHVEMLQAVNPDDEMSISVYNATGNIISNQPLEAGALTIDLPLQGQSAGIYFVRIVNGDQVETHRVVVE